MANKTINQYDNLGATPAAADYLAVWDADAAQQKKVWYSDLMGATFTGGGTIATGGFTLTVPATGTAALLGVANVFTLGNRFAYDADTPSYMGRAALGNNGQTDEATFAHIDFNDGTDYALSQAATGQVRINAPTGQDLLLCQNDAAEVWVNSNGLGVGKTPAAQLDVLNGMRAAYDLDISSYFGNAAIGYNGSLTDAASFSHLDHKSATNYGVLQLSTGALQLNAPTGQTITFRLNNSTQMTLDATGLGIGTVPSEEMHLLKAVNNQTYFQVENTMDGTNARSGVEVTSATGSGFLYATGAAYTTVPDYAESLILAADDNLDGGLVLASTDKIRMQNVVGTDAFTLIAGAGTFTAAISAAADTDAASTFGRAAIGYSGTADIASFAHVDSNAATTYALRHTAAGATNVNAASGQALNFSIAGNNKMRVGSDGLIAIADMGGPGAQMHISQTGAAAAIPTLKLTQLDVSEEMMEFAATIGTGNAIEAIGAKTLTTTHFIKVTLPGALTRYIPAGTIA